MDDKTGLILTGLDGSNPLAFLAALGTLRTLTEAWPDKEVKMRWVQHGGAWRPELTCPAKLDREKFLVLLEKCLARIPGDHPLYRVLSREDNQVRFPDSEANWASALTSDLAPEATSQLQTVRRDYFLGNAKNILERTKAEHLARTLFKLWDYADALENQSLHFDPSEDRRHAYQWAKPSGDPARKKSGGMLGANRLAIEAWPIFQAFAEGDRLQTRGFRGTRANNTQWTWPIWKSVIGLEVVSSLLALKPLQYDEPNARELNAMGIVTVYRCRRILVEKTPNFTPASAVF